jgi:hypothetical protein
MAMVPRGGRPSTPPNYNGQQQPVHLRSQPLGGRLQYGADQGGHLEDRRRPGVPGADQAFVHYPHEDQPGRSRVAADQVAHGWSQSRGRYVLSQPEQHSFEQQQQQLQQQQQVPQPTHIFTQPAQPTHVFTQPPQPPQPPPYNGMQQRAALRSQPVGGRLQYGPEAGGHLEERQREYVVGGRANLAPHPTAANQRHGYGSPMQQQPPGPAMVFAGGVAGVGTSRPPPQEWASAAPEVDDRFHANLTTEEILREQQRRERAEAQERRDRARADKERQEDAAKAERRQHQDQFEQMLAQRRMQPPPPQQQHYQQQQQQHQPMHGMSPAREYELARREEALQQQQAQRERQQQLEARTAHLSPQERKEARIVDWIRGGNPWAGQEGAVPLTEAHGNHEYISSQRRAASASGMAAARLQRSEERIPSHRARR